MICLIYAHPYPDRSRANRALLAQVADLPQVDVRSLYDRYPDFAIDVEEEQEALARAELVVFQHPLYWYSVPGLLKHYFDKVLARGWAYGDGARALAGKRCLWVVTTGGDEGTYAEGQTHGRNFAAYVPAFEQTARFCAMHWEPPVVLHGAHHLSPAQLEERAQQFRERLLQIADRARGAA